MLSLHEQINVFKEAKFRDTSSIVGDTMQNILREQYQFVEQENHFVFT